MNKLKAAEEFVKGKNGIGYVDSDFTKAFKKEEFSWEPSSKAPGFQKLNRSMRDSEIESELKPGICTLSDVLAFMRNPDEGCKDGYANIFYFPGIVVLVHWYAGIGEWSVNAWRRDDHAWGAGHRVFSPATDPSSLSASALELSGSQIYCKINTEPIHVYDSPLVRQLFDLKLLLVVQEPAWPSDNDTYFYVSSAGKVKSCPWQPDSVGHAFRKSSGNCFKTKIDAETYRENILATHATT